MTRHVVDTAQPESYIRAASRHSASAAPTHETALRRSGSSSAIAQKNSLPHCVVSPSAGHWSTVLQPAQGEGHPQVIDHRN